MNAVFTIVAKNYLAQARTLGDSITEIHPDVAFHILLADETEGLIDLTTEKYATIEVKEIGLPFYRDLAFKYDLMEFCTAVKPFFFKYLFEQFHYEKVVYFDPDIYVYSSLTPIFNALDNHFIVLTPHTIKLRTADDGSKAEGDFLICGTFNLGFVAFSNTDTADSVLTWWQARLKDKGYVDRPNGLFTDQKWMNLIPCLCEGVLISRDPGYNLAHWNMHERSLSHTQNGYYVDDQPLVFFHFSGFDPNNTDSITRPGKRGNVNLEGKPEYREIFEAYAGQLRDNWAENAVHSYAYAKFENGARIFTFHRRLYRRLTENQLDFGDPFSTAGGSYYDLLRQNGLVITARKDPGEYGKKDLANAQEKLRILKTGMRFLKKVIGFKYYHILLRTLHPLCRPEEQTFLLEALHLDLPIQFL